MKILSGYKQSMNLPVEKMFLRFFNQICFPQTEIVTLHAI